MNTKRKWKCVWKMIMIWGIAILCATGGMFFGWHLIETGSILPFAKSNEDKKALEQLIKYVNDLGGEVEENIDNRKVYQWNIVTGRLTGIVWDECDFEVEEISFAGLTGLRKLKIESGEDKGEDDPPQAEIARLDLSNNKELRELSCNNIRLKELDVSHCKKLTRLSCIANRIEELDLSKNKKLKTIDCGGNNIKILDLSKNKKLKYIDCSQNNIEKLNVNNLRKLKQLYCDYNELKKLDLRDNRKIIIVDCMMNQITELDLKRNKKMELVNCDEWVEVKNLTKNLEVCKEGYGEGIGEKDIKKVKIELLQEGVLFWSILIVELGVIWIIAQIVFRKFGIIK